ncbi:uncharacterized protein LOC127802163 [Diospyros lotus]|uniref:uncharacterized protein LOC127802163 n=1 Tax=Diospyros lotus TaxID=55363 RepID=UPI00225905E8|nr:uncharacterized protein LOC127802163 [Diospyros lotus]
MASLHPLTRNLDKHQLTGLNFNDWLLNLKLILNLEKITYVLDAPVPMPAHDDGGENVSQNITQEEQDTLTKWRDDDLTARSYMLVSMSSELQRQHANMPDAYSITTHLQELYGEQSWSARYEITKALFRAKMSLGGLVRGHVLKIISLSEKLKDLGDELNLHLQIDLILQSLPDSYGNFISNFYMNKIECTPVELMNMLIMAQSNMKSGTVMAVTSSRKTRKQKGKKNATQVPQGAKTIRGILYGGMEMGFLPGTTSIENSISR